MRKKLIALATLILAVAAFAQFTWWDNDHAYKAAASWHETDAGYSTDGWSWGGD